MQWSAETGTHILKGLSLLEAWSLSANSGQTTGGGSEGSICSLPNFPGRFPGTLVSFLLYSGHGPALSWQPVGIYLSSQISQGCLECQHGAQTSCLGPFASVCGDLWSFDDQQLGACGHGVFAFLQASSVRLAEQGAVGIFMVLTGDFVLTAKGAAPFPLSSQDSP